MKVWVPVFSFNPDNNSNKNNQLCLICECASFVIDYMPIIVKLMSYDLGDWFFGWYGK